MNSIWFTVVRSLAARGLRCRSCRLVEQSLFSHQALQSLPFPHSRSFHSQQKQKQKESALYNFSSVINDVNSKGWSFESLTAAFGSVQLTQPLVERVMLDFKEPNDAKKALAFFHWSSCTRNFVHGLRSYCLIVHILIRAGLLIDAQVLLESAIRKFSDGVDSTGFSVAEMLMGTYEEILPGRRVFDLLLHVYSKMRMVEQALDACRHLEKRGLDVNLISFNTMLRVAQKSNQNCLAWKVFEYMFVRRVYPNQKTAQIMIDLMCKEGVLPKTVGVLDRIRGKRCAPIVIANTELAFRIIEEDRAEDGIMLLKRMLQKNMVFDDIVYSLIIYAYCKMSKLDSAHMTRDEMIGKGCSLNAFVYTCFIGFYSDGCIDEALRLMEEMPSMDLKPYNETYNHLISGLARTGRTHQCLNYYEKMLKDGFLPSCAACNEILKRLCSSGEVEEANRILTSLLERGLVPDQQMYLNLIDGYGGTGKAQEILQLYYEMEHKGLVAGDIVYTSLVRNLCRCGKMNEAEKFFRIVGRKALVPTCCMYDSMIRGYCNRDNVQRALFFYDEMIRKELVPCSDTFMLMVKTMLKTELPLLLTSAKSSKTLW